MQKSKKEKTATPGVKYLGEKRIFRIDDVIGQYGFSKPTLYRMIKAGSFPHPVALTGNRAVGWRKQSLLDWENGLEVAK